MIEAIGIIHECVVCGESKVVDMSGWCIECYDAEEGGGE